MVNGSVMTELSLIQFFEKLSHDNYVYGDFGRCLVLMKEPTYAEYLCDGEMSGINDVKAHAFFHAARLWITFRRGLWLGDIERQLPHGVRLADISEKDLQEYGLSKDIVDKMSDPVTDNETVKFGVVDGNGKCYIYGQEIASQLDVWLDDGPMDTSEKDNNIENPPEKQSE